MESSQRTRREAIQEDATGDQQLVVFSGKEEIGNGKKEIRQEIVIRTETFFHPYAQENTNTDHTESNGKPSFPEEEKCTAQNEYSIHYPLDPTEVLSSRFEFFRRNDRQNDPYQNTGIRNNQVDYHFLLLPALI